MRDSITILAPSYIPGYKSGGPIKSIRNIVRSLSEDFDFKIITSDRESGDTDAYPNIVSSCWTTCDGVKVYYVSGDGATLYSICKLYRSINSEVVYINSFFNFKFSILFLVFRFLRLTKKCKIILAPRGEFSQGALSLKSKKKLAFISFARIVGLHTEVIWHASSSLEQADISRVMKAPFRNIIIAGNIPAATSMEQPVTELSEGLKLIFISRISPKKNIDYALSVLASCSGRVEFTIAGPVEDEVYWEKCMCIISALPDNIKVKYIGSVSPNNVSNLVASHDLFILPTLGENYGHVIAESLQNGTPVLISDTTPWLDLEDFGAGWAFPLSMKSKFISIVDMFSALSIEEKLFYRSKARRYFNIKNNISEIVLSNKKLFEFALTKCEY